MTYLLIITLFAVIGVCGYIIYRYYRCLERVGHLSDALCVIAQSQRIKLRFVSAELVAIRQEMQRECGAEPRYINGVVYINRLKSLHKAIQPDRRPSDPEEGSEDDEEESEKKT